MKYNARVEHVFANNVEEVWQAITTPRIIKEWCLQTNFKLKKEYPFYLRDTSRKKELVIQCRVIDFEENKSLTYMWGLGSHESTRVNFKISKEKKGTKLEVEHSGFAGIHGFFASKNFSGVWKKMIKDQLPKAMEKFFQKA